MATKNNDGGGSQPDLVATPSGGGAHQSQYEGGTIMVQGGSHVANDVDSNKADTVCIESLTNHVEYRIPQNTQISNFEK